MSRPPPDQPSPTKRQRRESTPRRPRADSSSATPDDLSVERHASAKRLHDVWDQLAEKYSRRIDEDDIVDLVTGEIVKDRGVLSAETPWKFGRFADESVDDSSATDEEEEDDDDIDPLDLLAEPPQVSIRNWMVPPVRIVDPADAQDLEDFMDAERRRRENGGEEEISELEEEPDEADASFDDESDAIDPLPAPPSRTVEIDDSDDELDSWGFVDESNVVSPVKSEAIEVLDSPSASPTRSSPRFKAPLPKMTPEQRPWPQLQLQTPPRSQTPSVLGEFATPVPTRPKPSPPKKLPTPKRVEEPMARSRSRGRSPLEPLPRLDLANIKRGRSTTRRTTRPVTEHDLGTPKASTSRAVEHISGKRDQPSSGKRSVAKAKQELSPEPYSALQSPAPQSTRKRKRKSLSVEDADPEPLVASSSSPSKGKQRASSVSTRIKSERPADISDVKPEFETPPASSHPYSHPGMPPYYAPPSFYPYPMYPPPPDSLHGTLAYSTLYSSFAFVVDSAVDLCALPVLFLPNHAPSSTYTSVCLRFRCIGRHSAALLST
ncbi:hypothetical protein C8R46DRAFT_1208352 [Mycena filopes]|nr:hypothetical protein C8R46DRAFT_1208352 [Mycena filopes]